VWDARRDWKKSQQKGIWSTDYWMAWTKGSRMELERDSVMDPSKDAMKDRRMAGAMASW